MMRLEPRVWSHVPKHAVPTHGLLLACLALASCAGFDERMQARIDANDGLVPQVFDAPESAGLLIVDVEMRHQGSLTWGRNQGVDITGAIVRRADTREITHARPKNGYVFFQLPPGTYELVSVTSHIGNVGPGEYAQAAEPFLATEAGPVTIAAGEVAYFGKLTVTAHSRLGQLGLTYAFAWDAARAHKNRALEVFLRRHPDSPWLAVVSDRLAAHH